LKTPFFSEPHQPSQPPRLNQREISALDGIRINKFLASAGFGSRRSVEELILKGSVAVNGSFCRNLSKKIAPQDDVRVNGKQIRQAPLRYLLLHKPAGYVCTRSDRFAAKTIFDLLPSEASTLFHVGRLDKESEGLLLITNDGALSQQLLHPSRGIDKEYEVILDHPFTEKAAAALKKGTWIEGAVARVESVTQLGPCKIKLVLHQGLKRQIRVMLGQLGFDVKRLVRTRLGPLKLRQLGLGKYRELTTQELETLVKATATSPARVRVVPSKKKNVPLRFQRSPSPEKEKRKHPLLRASQKM
jgi:23S rRNA pseudouridine2605 synthase